MGLTKGADPIGELVPAFAASVVFRSLAEQTQFFGANRFRETLELVRRMCRLDALLLRARRRKTLDQRRGRRYGFFDDFAQLGRIVAKNGPQPLDIEDLRVYAAASS